MTKEELRAKQQELTDEQNRLREELKRIKEEELKPLKDMEKILEKIGKGLTVSTEVVIGMQRLVEGSQIYIGEVDWTRDTRVSSVPSQWIEELTDLVTTWEDHGVTLQALLDKVNEFEN